MYITRDALHAVDICADFHTIFIDEVKVRYKKLQFRPISVLW